MPPAGISRTLGGNWVGGEAWLRKCNLHLPVLRNFVYYGTQGSYTNSFSEGSVRCQRNPDLSQSRFFLTLMYLLSLHQLIFNPLLDLYSGGSPWKNIPNSVCPAPNVHRLPVGSSNFLLHKAKYIVRWGWKARCRDIYCCRSFKVFSPFGTDP